MQKTQISIVFGVCCFAMASNAGAQTGKPGLWEVNSNMTWQQSPFPSGMSGRSGSPFGGGPHTTTTCITQEQMDKFGTQPPQTRAGCEVSNVAKQSAGMTADLVCTGAMSGKGTIAASWTDPEHSTSKIHFTGSLQAGPTPKPVEWTVESTSVFKSPDCGNVKPFVDPGK